MWWNETPETNVPDYSGSAQYDAEPPAPVVTVPSGETVSDTCSAVLSGTYDNSFQLCKALFDKDCVSLSTYKDTCAKGGSECIFAKNAGDCKYINEFCYADEVPSRCEVQTGASLCKTLAEDILDSSDKASACKAFKDSGCPGTRESYFFC